MCGIAGFIIKNPRMDNKSIQENVARMTSKMIHRGPDSAGCWEDQSNGVGLGHRRLSILDLSAAGHQPMVSPSGRYVIVLNGEIYNFREIEKKLREEKDYTFELKGHSDTEILLNAIERYGILDSLKMASGMFALAVWDRDEKELVLARDRLGEKPLYYGVCPNGFVFASELACFKEFGRKYWEIDRNSLTLFFRHNYIPAPYSILKNVWKLLPGHLLKIPLDAVRSGSQNKFVSSPYWDIYRLAQKGFEAQTPDPIENYENILESLLKKSIQRQMIADVPLGAFLSGGVDSSLIVGIMQSISTRPVKTFTIGFQEPGFNEANYAKEVAKHLGSDHTEMYVTPQMALEVVPKICQIYSEPFSDSSQIPTFLVSKLAKKDVTVALSGDAGDELFGGYSRYLLNEKIWKFVGRGSNRFRRKISKSLELAGDFSKWLAGFSGMKLGRISDKFFRSAYLFEMENYSQLYKSIVSHSKTPLELVRLSEEEPVTKLDSIKDFNNFPTNYEQMMLTDLVSYLPDDIMVKVDRAAMGVSLETRIPLLDPEIVEFSFRTPIQYKVNNGVGKVILRGLLDKYVPRSLIERPKKGFGVPLSGWLRGELKEWSEDLLEENRLNDEGYLNTHKIRKVWDEHISGQRSCEYLLWDALMFQSWLSEWKKG